MRKNIGVGGLISLNCLQMRTMSMAGFIVSNAYGCLQMLMIYVGGCDSNVLLLTDAYGGYGWVGLKYINAYGCLWWVWVGRLGIS